MKKQIFNHAKQCGEAECCGLVIDNNVYMPCRNIAYDPINNFEISVDDWIEASEKGQITAVVHSHPNGMPILSQADQFYQQKTAVDWWLVCDNHIYQFRYIKPLIGREFEHGHADCLTMVLDAYMLLGVNLPNYEREDNWWDNGKDYYIDSLPKNDFHQVKLSEIKEGDVILFSLNSQVANHAAVYIGNNEILHHLPKRLSKRDLFSGYWLKHYHSIWRHGKWPLSNFTAILNNMAINTK
ncbi:C40 family peptidase [Orbus mooreae]|uniref:C40 family peptidase n=1 Tax=Orbus mooreae TaxID=3074107 RepID=UPI00370DCC84